MHIAKEGIRTRANIVAKCEFGEDLYSCLDRLVKENGVRSGCFQAIGAVSQARVGLFHEGKYEWRERKGALEISCCLGNITTKEGKPFIHCHAIFTDNAGGVLAGHVGEGCIVDPTAEIHLSIYEGEIRRRLDQDTGLWVLDL